MTRHDEIRLDREPKNSRQTTQFIESNAQPSRPIRTPNCSEQKSLFCFRILARKLNCIPPR